MYECRPASLIFNVPQQVFHLLVRPYCCLQALQTPFFAYVVVSVGLSNSELRSFEVYGLPVAWSLMATVSTKVSTSLPAKRPSESDTGCFKYFTSLPSLSYS